MLNKYRRQNYLIRIAAAATISFLCSQVHADFPNCTPIKTTSNDNNIILSEGKNAPASAIYIIQNTSKQGIWLDHAKKNASASAGWNSFIRAGNWSAIKLDDKNFVLSCSIINPGKVNNVNCQEHIAICTPKKMKYDPSKKGSYWLAEDMDQKSLIKTLKTRGYTPITLEGAKF